MIVVGSMISLGYYLRVIAAVWMREAPVAAVPSANGRPVLAGASPEADAKGPHLEVASSRWSSRSRRSSSGIVPQPLFDFANHAASSLTSFL